jgi:hypothetical protein
MALKGEKICVQDTEEVMDFSYTIKAGTELFRGISTQNDISGNWFLFSIEDAKMYGSTIYKYIVKEDIKAINIQDGFFHIDYMNKVNTHFTGENNNGIDDRKCFALIPFGLPDIEFQIKFLKQIGYPESKLDIVEDFISRFYFNKHRFSDYEIDKFMVDCMRTFYDESYDGFTNPVEYQSKIDTPGQFKRELYVFNRDKIQFEHEIHITSPGGGGQKVVKPFSLGLTLEEMSERLKRYSDMHNSKAISQVILRDTGGRIKNSPIKLRRNYTRKNRR